MADTSKDTIYIDVEDEITTVIDKVLASKSKVVALVLPKRAAVFQSIVNMKLLKRKSDDAKKNLVLITTESSLLPLAGAIGLYVAKTLASRPEIPEAPDKTESMVEADEDEPINMDDNGDVDLATAAAVPIGVLAGEEIASKTKPSDSDMDTIELDNSESAAAADTAGKEPTKGEPKKTPLKKDSKKKEKGLKVPNFERFRLLLIAAAAALVILIFLIYAAIKIFPSATISIETDAANINTSVNFNMSTTATTLNTKNNTVPAKQVTENKTSTATVNATGQQNNGQKATGSVTMSATECAPNLGTPPAVPSGTGINANGLNYITQEETDFSPFGSGKGSCQTYQSSGNTSISAQSGGANYNSSNTKFTVPGRSDVAASGSANGGTDDIVQIVSQTDINNATNKLTNNNTVAKQDLTTQLQQSGYYAIAATFTPGSPATTPSASVGTAANSVTVTETVAYSMYGVHSKDLNTLLNNNITAQVSSNQSILDNGLSNANFTVPNASPTALNMQTTAEVGPDINVGTIKAQAVGKKSADIEAQVKEDPHVTNVTVHFSPFYVSSAPSNLSKIKVIVAKPTKTSTNGSNQ
jgi:hypothetical protein